MAKNQKTDKALFLESSKIKEFGRLISELQTFYDEISLISKKNPNESLNNFKINIINETVVKATNLLGKEFIPFPSFEKFDVADMPTASDVCVTLSQYINSMNRFEKKHTYVENYENYWYTKDGSPLVVSDVRSGEE